MFRAKKHSRDDESGMDSQSPMKKLRKEDTTGEEQHEAEENNNEVKQEEADTEESGKLVSDEEEVDLEGRRYTDEELDTIAYYGGSPPIPSDLPTQERPRKSVLSLIPFRRSGAGTDLQPSTPPRVLSSDADVTLGIRPFNCVSDDPNPGDSEVVTYLRCESKRVLELGQSHKWQALFHNLGTAGRETFEVAAGVDDFALKFVLQAVHPLHEKNEYVEDWSFEKFLRMAVFCQTYCIRNKEVGDLLSKKTISVRTKDGKFKAVHPENDLKPIDDSVSYIFIRPRWKREAWLLISWVFKWKKSFEALWKYFVWNCSLDNEGQLAHKPSAFAPIWLVLSSLPPFF